MNLRYLIVIFCIPWLGMTQNTIKQEQKPLVKKQISFHHLTVDKGLSQNSVVSITQDSIGYLWFATQDGLNRYDGNSFKYFNKQFEDVTKPNYSRLGKVYVDKEKQLWIISNSGKLELYNNEEESFQEIRNLNAVSTIFQDNSLNLYIGTYSNGLYKIKHQTTDTIQVFKEKDLNKTVYDFLQLKKSTLVATSNAVVELYNNGYKNINIQQDPKINFSALEKTKNETVWLGTYGQGLYYKRSNDNEFVPLKSLGKDDLPTNLNIEDLLVDKRNRLWVATYGQGLYLLDFNSETLSHFITQKNNPYAISYDDILTLYEDFTGTIWIGTDGAGLSYYDEHLTKFNLITNNQVPESTNVDVVRSIAVDSTGNIWIGTSGKGLTKINAINNEYRTFSTKNSNLASDRVMSLQIDGDDILIGYQSKGLGILNNSDEILNFSEFSNFTIWKIYKDSKGRFWLCTRDNGLIKFSKADGLIKKYNNKNSDITTNNIRTIEEGSNEILWIGTDDHGLFKFNPLNEIIEKINIESDKIKSLYAKDSILWIGTNGNGLKKYNTINGSTKSFTKKDGLPNDVIYAILPDDYGNLWLSSNRGITKFSNNRNHHIKIENYSNYDGLQAYEFNTGAYFKDYVGNLYFGGLEGINWFNPNQLTFNQTKPKTIISKVEIFQKEQELIQNATFKFKENTITFTFASLHFSQPERNLFKYQLINHDEDWISSGTINNAHYTNLEPNTYTFKVISSNYDNVWNEIPTTYTFTILPPWYFTFWAKLIYILLFLLTLFFTYQYLKWRWHMKMQLSFEHEETERLKKLNQFKTKLYTNISHEFRTPLTLISGPIDKQLNRSKLSKEDKEELTLVKQNANRLLNLVNQMLDLSKIESGNLKLKVSHGDLSMLLKQIAVAFKYNSQERQINFSYEIAKINAAWFDKDVVYKTVSNLLSNALKYTPKKGKVHLDVAEQNGQAIISVINNGNRLANEDLPKLFQRFYQANKGADGAGIGLSLVKELAILSHGNIVAHTMNDDELQFTITLPIERSYYNQSEIVHTDLEEVEDNTTQKIASDTNKNKKTPTLNKDKPLLLIVEDDLDIKTFIKTSFNSNYKIIEASNGNQGIDKAFKHIPDIIISDIMMPVKDGIELCNTLKQDYRTSHIPIVLLTAKAGDEHEIAGLKTGADAYITKPFNFEKLQIRVEKLIQVRSQLQERYEQTFKFQSKDIKISSVEHQFLEHLQEVIDKHITEPNFNAEALSKKMMMNRMQLHRKLKALTTFTTSEFLRIQRLKLSLELLKNSDATIAEVAYQVGFNTPSYFIKCFKEAYNCTPTEFIQKQ